jgi:hypothetical protein
MRVDETGKLLTVAEQLDIAIHNGPSALKELCTESGLPHQLFWVGARDHLNYQIQLIEEGLAANRQTIGFNVKAVEFILSHCNNIRSFIETMIIGQVN